MRYLMGRYGVSTRRACRVVQTTRSSAYYTSRKEPLTALRQRMRELAQARVRFGYRRLRVLLLREGWEVGKERFYRVYTEEGLALRLINEVVPPAMLEERALALAQELLSIPFPALLYTKRQIDHAFGQDTERLLNEMTAVSESCFIRQGTWLSVARWLSAIRVLLVCLLTFH